MDAICSVGETRTVPFDWGRGENVLAVVALVLVAALAFLALLPEAAFAKTGTNKKACAAYSKMLSKKTMPRAASPGAVSTKKIDGMSNYLYGFTVSGKKASYSACMKKIKALEKGAKDNLKYVKNTKANRKKYLK